jgi:hypothetical protein
MVQMAVPHGQLEAAKVVVAFLLLSYAFILCYK